MAGRHRRRGLWLLRGFRLEDQEHRAAGIGDDGEASDIRDPWAGTGSRRSTRRASTSSVETSPDQKGATSSARIASGIAISPATITGPLLNIIQVPPSAIGCFCALQPITSL
jgi:hypothetical protein